MSKTSHYRGHHGELRTLMNRIDALLDLRRIMEDAAPVAILIRELFAKFGVHLAMEDATLYPKMLKHDDPEVRSAAERFQEEMGGLTREFDGYRRRWRGPAAIAQAPRAFLAETAQVLRALRHRMSREDEQLYDLYDGAA